MLDKVFKAYDVRGVYPQPLNEELAWRIGRGCAAFLAEHTAGKGAAGRTVVVGRDMRTSSPSLSRELIRGITEHGVDVVDVGLIDTPMLYFAVNHLGAIGGVQTTASHNPPQYNGFKVCAAQAKPVGENSGLKEIKRLASEASRGAGSGQTGRVTQRDLWAEYSAHVHRFLDLSGKRLRVVVDASNGMAGTMIPRVFGHGGSSAPGLTIVEMNFENTSGVFAHEPNPLLPAAIADLRRAVVREKADLGLSFDGDADRCVVIDERGEPVGCDHLTAWLGAWFLKKNTGSAVVYDLRSSKAVEEDVRAAGGRPVRGRVGHVFLKELLAEHRAVFGGELSGHFYFRDNFNADSGAIAMASVLTALAESGRPVSECIRAVARYPQSGEMNFRVEDKDGALAALRSKYAGRGTIDELDGVTVDCFAQEGWWCNVRKSNTEPLLRLNLEARDKARLERMVAEIAPMLGERDHGH